MAHKRAERYRKTFLEHGESPRALQWVDYRAAAVRYKALVEGLDLKGKTILDAGCGMGDLLPYIYALSDSFEYLGVDPTEDFIATARRRYEGHHFKVGDPFADAVKGEPFDVVLCSGVLNAKSDNWLEERKAMIKRLYDLSSSVVAFNMAGSFKQISASDESRVAYADAQPIVDYCRTLTEKLVVGSNYHPKDFTVVLYK